MAVSLSTIATKDSGGTPVAGGLQAQDKSGLGTGPFTLGHIMIDGLAGTNMAAVTAANAVKVDGSAVTQPVSLTSTTITGTVAATQSGTWTVQPGNTANTTPWLAKISDGTNAAAIKAASTAPVATDPAMVVAISPNSVNANGQTTMSASAPVAIASNQSAIPVNPAAAATGGATNLHFFSVTGAPAAVAIKASAGTLYGVQAVNTGAAPVYLKLYNVAAASVTVGTTVPLVTIPVPTLATTGAGIVANFPVGIVFGTAMSYTFTNVAADNDATAVAVGTTLNVQFA